MIKFADEEAFDGEDALVLDEATVTQNFVLTQLEEFFATRKNIVLVDLDMFNDQQSAVTEIELNAS